MALSPITTVELNPLVTVDGSPLEVGTLVQSIFGAHYGDLGNNQHAALFGGLVQTNPTLDQLPWVTPGTFRNLNCFNDPTGVWTLMADLVVTTITAAGNSSDTTHSYTITPADLAGGPINLCLFRTGSVKADWQGNPVSTAIEFEADGAYTSGYGPASGGWSGGTRAIGSGVFGAQNYSGLSDSFYHHDIGTSIWYTVDAVPGAVTVFSAFAYFPGFSNAAQGLRYYLTVNGIVQDGSGGTPDTHLDIYATAADTVLTAVLPVRVPVALGDRVEAMKVNLGGLASGHVVGNGIMFQSTTLSGYNVCGATSSEGVTAGAPIYGSVAGDWKTGENVPGSGGPPFSVLGATNIGPITPTTLTGLIAYAVTPGSGKVITMSMRRDGATPSTTPTIVFTHADTGLQVDTDPAHVVVLTHTNYWDTQTAIDSGSDSPQIHWSYAALANTGSLIVFKTTIPDTDTTTLFPFVAGGGLSPTSFTLTNGAWRQFVNLPEGSGYSIQELVPAGWQMTASTNTGDPLTNLSITAGQQTSVEVVNRSVFQAAYTVEESPIRRQRRSPHLFALGERVFIAEIQIDLEAGRGATVGQGSNPQVMLRLSRDGGHTWSDELWMSAGRLGEYTRRVIYRKLGWARDWVVEVTVSDPISWSILGCWVLLEEGLS